MLFEVHPVDPDDELLSRERDVSQCILSKVTGVNVCQLIRASVGRVGTIRVMQNTTTRSAGSEVNVVYTTMHASSDLYSSSARDELEAPLPLFAIQSARETAAFMELSAGLDDARRALLVLLALDVLGAERTIDGENNRSGFVELCEALIDRVSVLNLETVATVKVLLADGFEGTVLELLDTSIKLAR